MERKWTEAQLNAIKARNRDILVSASAGSGKTSVLIERIIGLLQEGASLKRMLVSTFTKAAANEMKERLRERLFKMAPDDPHMAKELEELSFMQIGTLHSFCMQIIRSYSQISEYDGSFKVLDDARGGILIEKALEDVLDEFYENVIADDDGKIESSPLTEEEISDGQKLSESYSDEQIKSMVLTLFRKSESDLDGEAYLKKMGEKLPYLEIGTEAYKSLKQRAMLELLYAKSMAELCLEAANKGTLTDKHIKNAEGYLSVAEGLLYDIESLGYVNRAKSESLENVPSLPKKDSDMYSLEDHGQFKKLKGEISESLKAAASLLPINELMRNRLVDIANRNHEQRRALSKLAIALKAAYQKRKKEIGAIDYSDMERLAYKVLQNGDAAKEIADSFDHIFLDEYQDVSRTQEKMMQLIHRNNSLFMVGDVKQSIYAFRKAEPTLFIEKYESFSEDKDAEKRLIRLSDNFRSEKNIINAVNEVFKPAMRKSLGNIEYDKKAELTSDKALEGSPFVELHLLLNDNRKMKYENEDTAENEERNEDDNPEEIEKEARLCAKRILELLGTEIEENGKKRNLDFKDFAVLMRGVKSEAPIFTKVFLKMGIPVFCKQEARIYDILEINDMISIIRFLNNEYDDTALLSALSCPYFAYSPDELISIRLRGKDKEGSFFKAFCEEAERNKRVQRDLETLIEWRFLAKQGNISDFISYLLFDMGFFGLAGGLGTAKLRRLNLRKLLSDSGKGADLNELRSFLEEDKKRDKESLAITPNKQGANVVTLSTIHSSKGLEYPVVLLPRLNKAYNEKTDSSFLRIDSEIGSSLPVFFGKLKAENIGETAIKEKAKIQGRNEESRILYVAMTRAKHKLIMIGSLNIPKSGKAIEASPQKLIEHLNLGEGAYTAYSVNRPLYHIAQPVKEGVLELLEEKGPNNTIKLHKNANWEISYIEEVKLPGKHSHIKKTSKQPRRMTADLDNSALDCKEHIPQSLSISEVLHVSRGKVEFINDKRQEISNRLFSMNSELASRPNSVLIRLIGKDENEKIIKEKKADISRDNAIDRGNATHKLFCHIELSGLDKMSDEEITARVEACAENLYRQGVLSDNEFELRDNDMLLRFFRSDIGKRMLSSPLVKREQPLSYLSQREGVIIQGVVDCMFMEDGEYVILDYKTDSRVNGLNKEHATQVGFYMYAMEDILNTKIKQGLVYYAVTGEAYEVSDK